MREQKYRAWHKKEKKMYPVCGLYIKPLEEGVDVVTKKPPYHKGGIDFWKMEDIILLQFTGFKDKKGRETYAGDIIKNKEGNWKVEFKKYGIEPFNNFGHCCHHPPHFNTIGSFEVIGNIYLNSELLK